MDDDKADELIEAINQHAEYLSKLNGSVLALMLVCQQLVARSREFPDVEALLAELQSSTLFSTLDDASVEMGLGMLKRILQPPLRD